MAADSRKPRPKYSRRKNVSNEHEIVLMTAGGKDVLEEDHVAAVKRDLAVRPVLIYTSGSHQPRQCR